MEEQKVETIDVKELNISDLLLLYKYVGEISDRTFGSNIKGKELVRTKFNEIEKELHMRVFGCNPKSGVAYVADKVEKPNFVKLGTIYGDQPENIDLKKFDDVRCDVKTVVISGDKEASLTKPTVV